MNIMIGEIVDIEYEDGSIDIAKIVGDEGCDYTVVCLCSSSGFYRFSRIPYTVPKESIAGFYDAQNLEDTGLFTKIDDTYYQAIDSSDDEYEYDSEYDTNSETDISLISESS